MDIPAFIYQVFYERWDGDRRDFASNFSTLALSATSAGEPCFRIEEASAKLPTIEAELAAPRQTQNRFSYGEIRAFLADIKMFKEPFDLPQVGWAQQFVNPFLDALAVLAKETELSVIHEDLNGLLTRLSKETLCYIHESGSSTADESWNELRIDVLRGNVSAQQISFARGELEREERVAVAASR